MMQGLRSRRRWGSDHDVDTMTSPALHCDLMADWWLRRSGDLIASGKRCAFTLVASGKRRAFTMSTRWDDDARGWRVHDGFGEAAPVHVVDTMGPPGASIVT